MNSLLNAQFTWLTKYLSNLEGYNYYSVGNTKILRGKQLIANLISVFQYKITHCG